MDKISFFPQTNNPEDIANYHWIFGDGEEAFTKNATHRFSNPGIYEVKLKAMAFGGWLVGNDSVILSIVGVAPGPGNAPVANFTYWPAPPYNAIIYQDVFVDSRYNPLTGEGSYDPDDMTPPDYGIVYRYWDWGDGTLTYNKANATHRYATPGKYYITLYVYDADGRVVCTRKEINVIDDLNPVANFSYSPLNPTDLEIITFTDESDDSDGSIVNWTWNFGDGSTSNEQNPSHKYADDGTYLVNLTVTDDDGATNTIQKSIIVSNIPPTASFGYSPLNPTDLDIIQFTDSSSDSDGSIVNWTWNFGDGSISYEQDPTHQYADNGVYNVTLTVTDDDGATDGTFKHVTVSNVPPTADFDYHFKGKRTIVFIDSSTDSDGSIVNWTWNFGDGHISYEQNPTHEYPHGGSYTVVLTVTDNDGAIDSISKSIYVDTYPPYTDIWVNGTLGENDWYIGSYVVIAFMAHDSGSGVAYTKYNLDGDWYDYKYGSALGIWQNGEHTIEYYSADYAGNIEDTKSFSFKLDNKSPEIEVVYPNGGETVNGTVVIEWNATDNIDTDLHVNIKYSDDAGSTWHAIATGESNDGIYEWDTSSLSDGTDYLIRISTSDDAGNIGGDTSDGTFTIHNPVIPPSVSIIKPRGHLYIGDREIMPLPGNTTIIWGAITVEVQAESEIGIEKVEFYIDDELKATLTAEAYEWLWDETAFFTHTIEVIAYDNAGNTATDEQTVWIFNL